METKWYWLVAWIILIGIGIGTIYYYLRSYTKLLPKDQYQETEDEAFQKRFSILTNKTERFLLFEGTLVVAILSFCAAISIKDFEAFIFLLGFSITGLPLALFPIGLMAFLPKQVSNLLDPSSP